MANSPCAPDAPLGHSAPPTPSAPFASNVLVSVDDEDGFGCTDGSKITRRTKAFQDGTIVVEYFNCDGTPYDMTNFTGFTAASKPEPKVDWLEEYQHTDTATGLITDIKVRQITAFNVDGTVDTANSTTTYYDMADVDVTATVLASGTIAENPVYVQTGSVDGVVTGVSGVGLGALPANTMSGRIYIQVDADTTAAGVAFTTDGVAPSDGHQFQTSKGSAPIVINNSEELANLLMVPIGVDGEIDGSLSVQFSSELGNFPKE